MSHFKLLQPCNSAQIFFQIKTALQPCEKSAQPTLVWADAPLISFLAPGREQWQISGSVCPCAASLFLFCPGLAACPGKCLQCAAVPHWPVPFQTSPPAPGSITILLFQPINYSPVLWTVSSRSLSDLPSCTSRPWNFPHYPSSPSQSFSTLTLFLPHSNLSVGRR